MGSRSAFSSPDPKATQLNSSDPVSRPEAGSDGRFSALEHELDLRENAERSPQEIRQTDLSVFVILAMAALLLTALAVVVL